MKKIFTILFMGLICLGLTGCSILSITSHEHSFGEWMVVYESTENTEGLKKRVCEGCGIEETESIPKTVYSRGLLFELNEDSTAYILKGIGECSDTDLIIPPIYNGLPVESIGENAFRDNHDITSVKIPSNIKTIGTGSFCECSGLKSIDLAEGVEVVNQLAFFGCTSLEEVYIPSSLWLIGVAAFSSLTSCKSMVVSESNQHLTSKNGSNIIMEINTGILIAACDPVIIPDDIKAINDFGISYCSSIKEVVLPEGFEYLDQSAFTYCRGLVSVTLPRTLSTISNAAFFECTMLKTVNYNGSIEEWNSIYKGTDWNYHTGFTVVHCSDGDVNIN